MRHPESNRPDSKATRRTFLELAAGTGIAILAGAQGTARAEAEDQPAPVRPSAETVKLGLASYSLREFPLDRTVAMTVRLGLKHICLKECHLPLGASPEEIAKAVALVQAAGLDLYGGGVIDMKTEAQVNRAFDYAKAAGMRVIIASPAPGMLPLVNDKVKQFDIRVAIHNHGPGDKLYPTPESAYERVKDLDKRLGLCMDIGHTVRIGGDPVRDAKRFADRLLDVHMKDVTAPKPAGKTIEAGRGVIDLVGFLRVLLEIRYQGVVSFEFEKDGKDPLPGLAGSVGYVRGVLAALR
jgi:inosose dehydratase